MYTQFSNRLNARTNSRKLWERLAVSPSSWVRFLVQLHQLRKSARLLAELDARTLRDIGRVEITSHNFSGLTSRDPRVLAFSMQLLRTP